MQNNVETKKIIKSKIRKAKSEGNQMMNLLPLLVLSLSKHFNIFLVSENPAKR